MIAGKDQHRDVVEARRLAALPAPEPGDQLLEPAEASQRLGQARLALGDGRGGAVVAGGEVGKARAQIGETGDAAHASFANLLLAGEILLAGDGVEEGAGDMTAPSAGRPKRVSVRVEQFGKRLIAARLDERRIVELVPAQSRAGAPERAVLQQRRGAIAEMQAALGEARRMSEQASHGVTRAVGIDQPLPQHHVAAALAMHRAARGELGEPGLEARRAGERAGMQLRIAAGKPAGIAIVGRRLVGKRREGHDLGAGAAPAAQHMRIDEGEGCVGRRARCADPAAARRRSACSPTLRGAARP